MGVSGGSEQRGYSGMTGIKLQLRPETLQSQLATYQPEAEQGKKYNKGFIFYSLCITRKVKLDKVQPSNNYVTTQEPELMSSSHYKGSIK